ncbi:hypothetical protein L9F63_019760, partial [Diploptera punctata]
QRLEKRRRKVHFNLHIWVNWTLESTLAFRVVSMNALDRKSRSLLRKLHPKTFLRTQKSVSNPMMSDLEDFDHVFVPSINVSVLLDSSTATTTNITLTNLTLRELLKCLRLSADPVTLKLKRKR